MSDEQLITNDLPYNDDVLQSEPYKVWGLRPKIWLYIVIALTVVAVVISSITAGIVASIHVTDTSTK